MNDFQKTLFANLMALCGPDQEAFYYVDQSWLNFKFRIFLYRLASYTEFQKPGALECRGHTFRIDEAGNALELVSMPMQKFFNLDENPFVMGLDLSTIAEVMDKLDGSLISSVKVDDQFILKSKGSLHSGQAQAATRLIETKAYEGLRDAVAVNTELGRTVNMEYMAPDNRIVIGYMEPTLRVLNVRDNKTGAYLSLDDACIPDSFKVVTHPLPADGKTWAYGVADMLDDIEGYCVRLADGTWFKLKTDKYKALHHTKDSITVPRRLFESCVLGAADDLRSMFATDPLACAQIDAMQEKVAGIYNHIHKSVHDFHNENKGLERKDYALKGQADAEIMKQGVFSLAMNLYLGKDANVEEFMVKNYKKYGIKDEAPAEAVE